MDSSFSMDKARIHCQTRETILANPVEQRAEEYSASAQ